MQVKPVIELHLHLQVCECAIFQWLHAAALLLRGKACGRLAHAPVLRPVPLCAQ